jgi:hypothetical protein
MIEEVDRDLLVGERKHVTVLCADLKDSLERLAAGDAEKALEIFEAALTLMKQVHPRQVAVGAAHARLGDVQSRHR